MAREGERGEAGLLHGDAEFLVEFPDQRLLWPFTQLDLAARELPEAGQLLALRPLRDQHAPVRIDERHGGDEEELQGASSHFI
jgi:hypothetical protein